VDVVRAALSEVEDYRRVQLRRLDEAMVAGAAGAELAHLIAELVENALSFSSPDHAVEVFGQHTATGYVLAVLDHGIGMSPEDLARANGRLGGEESFTVAPTRYLGHYVVGVLASRLGVHVRLQEAPLTGIAARISLPGSLIAQGDMPDGPSTAPTPGSGPPAFGAVVVPEQRPFRLGRDNRQGAPAPVAVLEPPASPPRDNSQERTRNGLVKRVRGVAAAEEPPGTQWDVGGRPDPTSSRSAADVRSTLTDFRSGFQRHEHEQQHPESHDTDGREEQRP
jgi:hypothetical protein